ncbi:MAG: type II and III secretion system protein family protein, partial [Pseudomonadota bacterium]
NRAIVVESAQPFVEVSVAQPEIADVSPLSDRAIYIFGRARGVTTLTLLGENGQLIANVEIRVSADLSELKQRLAQVFPEEPIDVRPAGGGVILSGVVSGASVVDRAMTLANAYIGGNIVNMMSVGGTQQVAVKVRIATMERSIGKTLGISSTLGAGDANDTASFSTQTGTDSSFDPIENLITTTTSGFGSLGALFTFGDTGFLNIVINAAEDKGFIRTLAEPTLITRSGTTASFLAGGEVPVPVITEDGADVEFKTIGVSLSFLPTVLEDDLISIALSAEISDVDPSNSSLVTGAGGVVGSVVGFNTTRAETTVNLRDGESFAIAGLFSSFFSDGVGQVPWLGDIPVFGTLFRDTTFSSDEEEVVIIVTANLVVPVADEGLLAIPQDRIEIPNERSLFLLGRTEGPSREIGAPSQGFDGSFGYVVE